jgi:pyridoxamine 5'-phosphate oxidase
VLIAPLAGARFPGVPRPPNPLALFARYLEAARRGVPDDFSDAMCLSTTGARGRPRSRMVLLRGLDRTGLVFFTNFRSAKGREIAASDRVALCLHWPHLKVQVRVEGRARPVEDRVADDYFASRPRDSQLAAWASDQSRPLASRSLLLSRFEKAKARFEGGPVPRPPHWSGFRVTPDLFEFWTGREHRLHDRQVYLRRGKAWRHSLLNP